MTMAEVNCERCHGIGRVTHWDDNGRTIRCPYCDGTGRVDSDDEKAEA